MAKLIFVYYNVNGVNMAAGVIQNLMRKEVFWSLVDAENKMGNKAFTCRDLFNYFNRVFFHDFDPNAKLNAVELNIQMQFAVKLVETVNANNITGGLTDVSAYLHVYLIEVRDHLQKMMESEQLDDNLKANCELILLKMNREFFNKTI